MRPVAFFLGCLVALSMLASSATAQPNAAALTPGKHDVALGEVSLHYVVRGRGPLLIVTSPGWGVGSTYLQNGLAPLESKFTLVYVNTRASGGSTRPMNRARMSQEIMADDLDAFRARLGLNSIDLLGHSDGGTIAIDYAVRHGGHLRRLIVVDGCVLGDADAKAATEAMLKLWADDPHFKAAVHALKIMPAEAQMTDAQFDYWLDAITPLYLSDPDRLKPVFDGTMKGTELHVWAAAAEDELVDKEGRHQLATAGSIRAKVLIMNGTVDWVCPYQGAQNLHAAIPGSLLSLYANKAHFPWVEDPDRFFREVSDFLHSSSPAESSTVGSTLPNGGQ